MKNRTILLKTLLLSTSRLNIYKYSSDSKKRNKIVSAFIGEIVLFGMLMAYSIFMCIGYGQNGLIDAAPAMCAMVISILAFFFTVLRTNGYLFNFKEYDMLMSLPLPAHTIAGSKFVYMFVKMLPWYVSISVAMLAGYGYYAHPSVLVYPLWMLLSLFLPVIPMLLASFIGFLIARISAGFRKTNTVQTVLTFAFVLFCFSLRYIIEEMFRDDKVGETMQSVSDITQSASQVYLPLGWFSDAVTGFSAMGILLLVGVSTALFAVMFYCIGKSYRNINSALKSHAAAKKYRMSSQKSKSQVSAIAFKEFKRMTGSTTYMVNVGMGVVLATLFGVVTLITGMQRVITVVMRDAPITSEMLQPAIPWIIYFFIGMMSSTACSPSLEGKNYWIVQSLPIEKKTLYQGKMLFNMYLTVPFSLLSTVCLCIAAKTPLPLTLLYLLQGVALCAFSTAWGCVCGVRHLKLDWENEVEVIKQGAAVTVYLLPNMFVAMALCALTVFLGTKVNYYVLAAVLLAVVTALAGLSYRRVMRLSKEA